MCRGLQWCSALVLFALGAPFSFAQHDIPSQGAILSSIVHVRTVSVSGDGAGIPGRGFPVAPDGVVATNYHVVQNAVFNPNADKVQVEVPGSGTFSARILTIDVPQNIAILQIKHQFPITASLYPLTPAQGEWLQTQWASQTVESITTYGLYERINLSSAIPPRETGGPLVNAAGYVVGMLNVIKSTAGASENVIPSPKLIVLLETLRAGRQPASVSTSSNLKDMLSVQLDGAERAVLREIKKDGSNFVTPHWKVADAPADSECTHEAPNLKGQSQSCISRFFSAASQNLEAGRIETQHLYRKNHGEPSFSFFRRLGQLYETSADGMWNKRIGYASKAECNYQVVVNRRNIPLKVDFCVAPYKGFADLSDAVFKISTLDKGRDALILVLRMRGFHAGNIKETLETYVDSFEKI